MDWWCERPCLRQRPAVILARTRALTATLNYRSCRPEICAARTLPVECVRFVAPNKGGPVKCWEEDLQQRARKQPVAPAGVGL